MIEAYTVEQIRAVEAIALERDGDATLMRRASFAVAAEVAQRVPFPHPGRRVVLLVGAGNNGGDALYAGAFLRRRGMAVTAALLKPSGSHPGGLAALRRAGGRILAHDDPAVGAAIRGADVIVDGIVGIGAVPPLRPAAVELIGQANATDALRVAVDLPSGVEPDTGRVRGVAFLADVTVTFGGIKVGLLIADEQAGTIVSVPIGMDMSGRPAEVIAMTDGTLGRMLPPPAPGAAKYSGGLVGIVAGSPGYPGAAVLCAGGAVRTRPGMVRYAGPQAGPVVARWPEVVAVDSPADAGKVQAWVIGPGMGTEGQSITLLRWVLGQDVPVLVDADGLTVLAGLPSLLQTRRRAGQPTVLTPHDREFARLFPDIELDDRLAAVRRAAWVSGATVLLKGHRTLIADPGGQAAVNLSGSSWLASAGTGDVLSGVVGSLLAAGLPPLLAAAAGAFLHGRAGQRAQRRGLFGAHALWDHLQVTEPASDPDGPGG
ncbi:NAD(P)H-hydrate dehydratase [Nakamurella sp.]|uniref:NAD(P)H-hydrate dehydratase n=1 Tax=Nakamurella sp. TaxID=1869182 RepID=UPI003B39FE3D